MSRIEFNLSGYSEMLDLISDSNYFFSSYKDRLDDKGIFKKCLLRHDIDADLFAAKEMANIEYKKGVNATYFLMLRSPIYNLFSRANDRMVREIVDMGHHIGLHFDGAYLGWDDIQTSIEKEAEMLASMLKRDVYAVSFHQPNQAVIDNKLKVNGFVNTYDKEDMKDYFYLSDSNKIWKHYPEDVFTVSNKSSVQLLIHPMWWLREESKLSTRQIWQQTILRNLLQNEEQLLKTERAYGSNSTFVVKDAE